MNNATDETVAIDDRITLTNTALAARIDQNAARERTARIGNHMARRIFQRRFVDGVQKPAQLIQAPFEPLSLPLPVFKFLVFFLQTVELLEQIEIVDQLLLAPPRINRRL